MLLEKLQQISKSLPGVTEDIKWEDHLCFNVGEKMFLITSPDKIPVTACFKVNDENFNKLCEKEGFSPAPYLGRYKWVLVDDINRISVSNWERYISDSYQLIYDKLPLKIKKEIKQNQITT
jgi:predicted DNA-binding protein (MmcQ/YjbR family)